MQVSKDQVKSIYKLGAALGLVERNNHDDPLHQLVQGISGKDNVTALSQEEAAKVLGELIHRMRYGNRKVPLESSRGGVSGGQQQKILALMLELRKYDKTPSTATVEQRVAGIIRREFQQSATPSAPYRWLTYRDGARLIEIIKGYLATAQRKMQTEGTEGTG